MKYDSEWVFYSVLEKNIEDISRKYDLKERKIIFFGITEVTNVAINILKQKEIDVYAIIDNNPSRKAFADNYIRVYKPEELLGDYDSSILVLIGTPYYTEMCEQLEKMGYIRGKNIYQIFDPREMQNEYGKSNLREITEDESKNIQFEILKYIHELCKKNNLEYYLAYGSLLGAVRHHGFIPWDDDIDIYMPIGSIKKLYELMEEESKYRLCMPSYTEGYFYLYARVIDTKTVLNIIDFPLLIKSGISIDIFPLVGLGDTDTYAKKIMDESYRKQKIIKSSISRMEDRKNICQNIRILWRDLEKIDYKECKFCGNVFGPYGNKEILASMIFEQKGQYQFENSKFWGPKDYDVYLSQLYGNYMTYPPLEKRISSHIWKGYWLK